MKKIIILSIVVIPIILILVNLDLKGVKKEVPNNIQTSEQKIAQENEIVLPVFDKNMSIEEVQGIVYDTYKNKNIRLVGAVVQDVFEGYITVKTYKAGPGTTSIVKDIRINITEYVPVFETAILFNEIMSSEPIVARKTVNSLQEGDYIVVECVEDKSMEDAEEFTAVFITKDVMQELDGDLILEDAGN